jgi:agmatinase
MKFVAVPGINGMGMTNGVENSFVEILKGYEYEKIDLNNMDIEEQLKQIFERTRKYFDFERVCFVGGDHSISYPLVKNFYDKFGEGSKILVFDAHPDLMEPMSEPTHEEWLRGVIERGVNPKNVMVVGVRRDSENVDKSEILYAEEMGVNIIYSDEFDSRRQDIINFVDGEVYLSFDIDVFDSSIVSATGYPENNGLNEEQVFPLLEEIKDKINFFDLVEVNLTKTEVDECDGTVLVARKVLEVVGK